MQHISTQVETWKPVIGWEGYYEVSDHGRVRSLDRVHSLPSGALLQYTGRIRKAFHRTDGYWVVTLSREGKPSTRLIHRLVMESFAGPCPKGMEVCHGDGDSSNNHLDNLRYDTSSANTQDIVKHGKHHYASASSCKRGHKLDGWNCKPSSLKRGQRQCRACSITHSYVGNHPEKKHLFDQIANEKFQELQQLN